MKDLNIGISTSVGIGGDPINGSSFKDIIGKFEEDDETDAILMIGEIGGPQEVAAGKFANQNMKKPVIAYIAGLTAPKGRVMGHAGAIVSAYGESAVEKEGGLGFLITSAQSGRLPSGRQEVILTFQSSEEY